jgi:long-chain fatty acid transport protein
MRKYYQWAFSVVLATTFFATSAWAGAVWLFEQAAPDMGLAAAGRAALANDPSTAGANPAGMTRLDRSQLLVGFLGLDVSSKFEVASAGHSGGSGGDAGGFVPAATLAYVHSLSPDLKLGVFAGSYFGLGIEYDDGWAGRYHTQKAELVTMGINPGIGYRVNEWLSIGGGIGILYGKLEQTVAVNNALDGLSDGKLTLEEEDVNIGGNVGILIEPTQRTRFGVTYRSAVDLEFDDVARAENIGPTLAALSGTGVDLEMTIPQAVMVSAYHGLTDRFAIMANLGWQDWSEFGKTEITIRSSATTTLTDDRNFDDTWHAAIGAQYRITDPWLLSVGFAYDTDPVEDATYNQPDLPLDRQIRYAAGIQYDWNQDVTVGAAYTFLDLGDANVDLSGGPLSGGLEGKYETNHIQFFNLNLIWRF